MLLSSRIKILCIFVVMCSNDELCRRHKLFIFVVINGRYFGYTILFNHHFLLNWPPEKVQESKLISAIGT